MRDCHVSTDYWTVGNVTRGKDKMDQPTKLYVPVRPHANGWEINPRFWIKSEHYYDYGVFYMCE